MAIKLEVDREEGGKNNMCPTITYPCVSPYMCGNTAKRRNDLSCRDNIYSQLREPNDIDTAWIIAGLPRARDREQLSEKLKAKIVLLLFNKETCLNRISNHQERLSKDMNDYWKPIVEKWFNNYSSGAVDEIIDKDFV